MKGKEVFVFTRLTFRQNRFVIVSSVIAKIFNPQVLDGHNSTSFERHSFQSVPVSFIASYSIYCLTFVCSVPFIRFSVLFVAVLLFDSILLLSVQIIQCMFCPDPGNVFKVFWSC
jgi:hypothetical protein